MRRDIGMTALLLMLVGVVMAIGQLRDQTAAAVVESRKDLTVHTNFLNTCIAAVTGYAPEASDYTRVTPTLGHFEGGCADKSSPLIASVTHENAQNNHGGAANTKPNIGGYVGDFDYDADFGKWLTVSLNREGTEPVLSMALDTIHFNSINVTGWALRYGHLFLGVNDSSVKSGLNKDLYVEFDILLREAEVRPGLYQGYSGRRVLLGTLTHWSETAPRTNVSHFFETDLIQSERYTESYGEPDRSGCKDTRYDRCFYDPSGKYAEGREVRYQTFMGKSPPTEGEWTHIVIPLSQAMHRLRWISPPADWAKATLGGIYFGIESEGATRTVIELRGYRVYEKS
jgi:hypothetical protein